MVKIVISLFLPLLMISSHITPSTPFLTIQVDNVTSVEGQLWFGVYTSSENFLQQTADVRIWGRLVDKTGSIRLQTEELPFGTYAVAVFHDQNGNGKLDQNIIGIPQEPYAFSNTLKSKWRAPSYDEVKFTFSRPHQELRMRLEEW